VSRLHLFLLPLVFLAAACVVTGESGGGAATDVGPPPDVAASEVAPTTVTTTASTTTTTAPTTTTTEAPDPIDVLVASLTVEQRVGQLLMPILLGTDAGLVTPAEARANQSIAGVDSIAQAFERYYLGGVLYLGDNIANAGQLTELSAGIQLAAQESMPGVGALISVDQEGGRVNRVKDGVELFPSARSFGGDAAAAEAAAGVTANGLSAQGINIVLAPVADLTAGNAGVIGDRSYSEVPQVAARMVAAVVRGLQGNGVAAAAKHWPGHGATTLDSHAVLPLIEVDLETWRARERVPFAAAVDNDVAIVMIGHLALPQIDPGGQAATVSPLLVNQLLRVELGFDGVVMSDALDMGAVRGQDRAELAILAVEAGIDILLATPDVAVVHQGLVDAVAGGRISEERLNASVARILRLKDSLGLLSTLDP